MASGNPSPVDVAHALRGISFPAGKDDLVDHARNNDADDAVIEVLDRLPAREYGSMADVENGVGQLK